MAGYTEQRVDVNGIDTAVFTAGQGPILVFLHGAGTLPGFDSLLPLAERFRLVVPHHPGFGASADDPSVTVLDDYVRHYLDLFDALEIDELSLIGHSLGGCLAANFAITQGRRVQSLVLAAPLGLRVREHPTLDIFSVPDEKLPVMLTANIGIFDGKVPMPPTPEFLAERYRELTSAARVLWERAFDPRLAKWLHRVTVPTLLLWGDKDQVVPVEQAPVWAGLVPGAQTTIFPEVGHLLFDESPAAAEAAGDFVAASVGAAAG
jgi:pimeloyl-ACP methyl ester carboxylesterase